MEERIMRKSLLLALSALTLFCLVSCDEESGDTRIVYYPSITLEGGDVYLVTKGTTYVDPGFTALLNGEDVSADVVVTSTVNTDEYGIYTVEYYYEYYTEDGYFASSSSSRTVIVCEEGEDVLSGTYTTTDNSYRLYNGTYTYPGYTSTVSYIGGNAYYVSDFLAGWYAQRAGYGSAYAMTGYMLLNSDNSIDVLTTSVSGWGDSADYFEYAQYDGDSTLSWGLCYAGYLLFYVEMTK